MRSRLLLLLLAVLGLLAACSASTATPQSIAANGGADGGAGGLATTDGSASSSAGPGSLAQLLSAPIPPPVTTTTTTPGEPPPPPPAPYKTGPRAASPVIIPSTPIGPGDGTAYAVGDSVLLGASDYLRQTVGGWDLRVDARVGRRFPEGIELIRENQQSLGQAVIILLGHNYGGGGAVYGYLDQLMSMLYKVPRVVFVTVKEWNPAIPEVNRAIRALPKTYPNVVVADWSAVVDANPQFLVDNVHLNAAGSTALANLIAVMLGPANPNGRKVPPPKILPIPDDPSGPKPSTTTTTTPAGTSTTSSSTTTSTVAPTTTTTAAPTTTSSSTSIPVSTTAAGSATADAPP